MGEIINLNKARKAAEKARKADKAQANRSAFGLSKLAKTLAEKQKEIDARRLDSAKRHRPEKD